MSCAHKSFGPVSYDNLNNNKAIIFNRSFSKAIYKTDLNIYGHNITGITMIKKTNDSFRFVLISELGIKYFDFEIFEDKGIRPIIHYAIDQMDNKLLIKKIINDIALIFILQKGKSRVKKTGETEIIVFGNTYYDYTSEYGVSEIAKSNLMGKINCLIKINYGENKIPESIIIDHDKVNIKLSLIPNG
ncbi:MAG: hypothetical protein CMF58_07125 [Lentimicrobiaceae bacterium]|nr:hypothetical protein [Lentimicrobiaceae bacterium]|tara:strand:+ start:497 stop:1060 length:564 start_codon:yes stop_codon:yes gene_type:complete